MPPLQERDTNVITPVRRGPKLKQHPERIYTPPKRIQRVERSYSLRKKDEVIMFLTHHKIFLPNAVLENQYRLPTLREAVEFFKIPSTTIHDWKKNNKFIELAGRRVYGPYWPDLEKQLLSDFLEARANKRIVTISWFRRQSRSILKAQPNHRLYIYLLKWTVAWISAAAWSCEA